MSNGLELHTSRLPTYLYLFSFTPPLPSLFDSPLDFIAHPIPLYIVGVTSALLAGVGSPAGSLVSGWWTNTVTGQDARDIKWDNVKTVAWIHVLVGLAVCGLSWLFLFCLTTASEKMTTRLRSIYLASILSQDSTFFTNHGPGEIASLASNEIRTIHSAYSQKTAFITLTLSQLVSSIVVGFYTTARLAGVIYSVVPFSLAIFVITFYFIQRASKEVSRIAQPQASYIEQILASVRLVHAYTIASPLLFTLDARYLGPLERVARARCWGRAAQVGGVQLASFMAFSLTFWYAGRLVSRNGVPVGDVMVVFWTTLNAMNGFAAIIPFLSTVTEAGTALRSLRRQIERTPLIDVRHRTGLKPEAHSWTPTFQFENVTFAYPSRPHVKSLDNVSLTIPAGQVTAIVGSSGSGKSTMTALLVREFDPQTQGCDSPQDVEKAVHPHFVSGSGTIRMSEVDIKTYNLEWYRQQIAMVAQDPQLLSATVFENVAVGLAGTLLAYDPLKMSSDDLSQTRKLVETALRRSEAWAFVCDLPNGMDTLITGNRAHTLSGGQRQRIALARALVRSPRILILDEATSALDTRSERAIGTMIERECAQRDVTVIVITHRLTTVKGAGQIVVMDSGRVVDTGTYDELMDETREDRTFGRLVEKSGRSNRSQVDEHSERAVADIKSPTNGLVHSPHETASINPIRTKWSLLLCFWRTMDRRYRLLFTLGLIWATAIGVGLPLWSYLFAQGISAISIPQDNQALEAGTSRWALWFLLFAIGVSVGFFISGAAFELTSEHITRRLGQRGLQSLLRQDVGYFESTDQTDAGALTVALGKHTTSVTASTGLTAVQIISAGVHMMSAPVLGFVLSWKITAVSLPPLILVLATAWLNVSMLQRYEAEMTHAANQTSSFISETVNVIRTITSFNYQRTTLAKFNQIHDSKGTTLAGWRCLGFALTSGVLFWQEAFLFIWAGKLILNGETSITQTFGAYNAVMITFFSANVLMMYVSDISRFFTGMAGMQAWFDRKPLNGTATILDSDRPASEKDDIDWGHIELRGIGFRYPQRPERPALHDITLTIESGRTHAFCGASGSGKSTIVALLLRFYEPCQGSLTFGGKEAGTVSLDVLRSKCAYVSQDPHLFEGSIRWNICLGALDPDTVSQQALEEACQQACILEFIRNLKDGFETEIGMKGAALSGGQRQRLCIARALIRNPQVLILDEATSALDTTSEHHVNQALANVAVGRTTIVVAHRLSTIRNADKIHVIEEGRVIEEGSHDELMARKGRYLELVEAQL